MPPSFITRALMFDIKPASSVARATSSVTRRGLVLYTSDGESGVLFVRRLSLLRLSLKYPRLAC